MHILDVHGLHTCDLLRLRIGTWRTNIRCFPPLPTVSNTASIPQNLSRAYVVNMPTHKMRAGGGRQVAQARVHRLRDREALVKRTIGQQLPVRSRKRIVSSTQSAATHPSPRALGRHCHRTTPGCYTCCTGETLRIRASPQQDSISGAREMLYINCVLTRHVRYDIGSRSTRTYQQPVLQYCCAP
jgi:hypothetical protein